MWGGIVLLLGWRFLAKRNSSSCGFLLPWVLLCTRAPRCQPPGPESVTGLGGAQPSEPHSFFHLLPPPPPLPSPSWSRSFRHLCCCCCCCSCCYGGWATGEGRRGRARACHRDSLCLDKAGGTCGGISVRHHTWRKRQLNPAPVPRLAAPQSLANIWNGYQETRPRLAVSWRFSAPLQFHI